MTYRIFVSHTTSDKLIAEEITSVLNNAFEGDIEFYLACHEIGGGDEWKKAIRDNLYQSDAIICLITTQYVNKPWLYIEWSAFWIADKKFYILLTDDINSSDLIHPMTDRQITYLLDKASVRKFFRSLSTDSKHKEIPYDHVQFFIDAARDALIIQKRELEEKSYSKYKTNLDKLPADDMEKKSIAEHFYETGDREIFHQIVSKIRDDGIKSAMTGHLISQGDLVEVAQMVEKIISADKLVEIAIKLIDLGYHDSRQLKDLIDTIAHKNQAELRKIVIYLLDRGEGNTALFNSVILSITNMAEMRKILSHLISKGQQRTAMFADLFDVLRLHNQRETEKIMVELVEYDKDLFSEILKKNIITNKPVLERLNQLSDGLEHS